MAASKQALTKLGAKRETAEEQSLYLLDISIRFQDITGLALNANYAGNDWFDQRPSLKFATAVTNRSELFASTLERYGHSYKFEAVGPDQKTIKAPPENEFAEQMKNHINTRTTEHHVELDEVTVENETITKEIGVDTLGWLTKVYTTSRGFELGTFDNSLIAMTMKTQSSKWELLALGYISDVISLAHAFIIDLLQLICVDTRVRDGLLAILMDSLMIKYQGALDNVHFLLHVERMGRPTTLNRCFHENLEERFLIM